jgi:hypothetical protein
MPYLSKSHGHRLSRTAFARLALLPLAMAKLVIVGASGDMGLGNYAAILSSRGIARV